MVTNFIHAFRSEWLKTRNTAGSWLVVIGGFFIPLIMLLIAFYQRASLPKFFSSTNFWQKVFLDQWQSMAMFLLPMGVILATSLITQLEYRNNTWKLVHTLPQSFRITFSAKLSVILVMMAQFFLLFNIGVCISSLAPALIFPEVDLPSAVVPLKWMLKQNALFYLDCLPIIAIQYLISLRYKNFMVPIGVGLALVICTMFAVRWEYGYIIPYTYTSYCYLSLQNGGTLPFPVSIHYLSAGYFAVITALSYLLYRTRTEIG